MEVRALSDLNAADGKRSTGYSALFALGFRPFYLLAAVFAALSVPLWIAQYFGWITAAGQFPAMTWHAHEMTFGFAVAVITGFLFTAVPNWTQARTPVGSALAALAALWIAGRVLMLTGPHLAAAIVDVAFLVLVAWSIWRPLHQARNRNQFFVAILLAFAAANGAFHLAQAGWVAIAPLRAVEAALGLVTLIVAIMAGRVIPAFTRNAIPHARVRQIRGLDTVAIGALALALIGWIAALPEVVVIPLCIAAALAHAARMWQWDPLATRARPMLWILHVSYAWIPAGMLLLAFALAGIAATPATALHALGIGAIGGMIIGMMTRTARGHTGRPLIASKTEVLAYLLVHLAAVFRVVLPLAVPRAQAWALIAAMMLFSGAFALYAVQYWSILTRPRIDGKAG